MNQKPGEGRFNDITIFTTEDGATRVEVRFQHEASVTEESSATAAAGKKKKP